MRPTARSRGICLDLFFFLVLFFLYHSLLTRSFACAHTPRKDQKNGVLGRHCFRGVLLYAGSERRQIFFPPHVPYLPRTALNTNRIEKEANIPN
jgi:hypothetical protein